jgi:hypothetical protein
MKARKVLVIISPLIVVLLALAIAIWTDPPNPPYAVEVRQVVPGGSVSFKPMRYIDSTHEHDLARLRGGSPWFVVSHDMISYAICCDGLTYCFSKSGRVFAMDAHRVNEPSDLVQQWSWQGDPHQFPHYDYGTSYRKELASAGSNGE